MAGRWYLDPEYDAGLDRLRELQARESGLFAERARVLARLVARTTREGWQADSPFESLQLDVAGTCVLGQVAAGSRLSDAEHLVVRLGGTLDGLESGVLAVHQAQVVVSETRELAPEVCAEVERRVLPLAPELCPADLRRLVRRTVLEVDAAEQERREAEAARGRRVWVKPVEDGMALLCALLPADQAQRAYAGLTDAAGRVAGRDDERCADERRADALVELLSGGGSGGATRPLQVVVHVPVASALGLSDAPAELEGHGPISAAQARRVLDGPVVVRRACVDPVTGEVWALDAPEPAGATAWGGAGARGAGAGQPGSAVRDLLARSATTPAPAPLPPEPQHDPSAALARLVRARDVRCDGIGCSVPARRCELDHLVPWPEGDTSAPNLRSRSQRCHHAKHAGWSVEQDVGGSWWTSPAGRRYRVPRRGVHPPPDVDLGLVCGSG